MLTASLANAATPNKELTPGSIVSANKKEVCVNGYSKRVRHVTSGLKEKVYESYGIYRRDKAYWAIDHLVPLCAGGSNDQKNLWPMMKYAEWGKNKKDTLERIGCKKVCEGKINLQTFQHDIATNWILAYGKYVNR